MANAADRWMSFAKENPGWARVANLVFSDKDQYLQHSVALALKNAYEAGQQGMEPPGWPEPQAEAPMRVRRRPRPVEDTPEEPEEPPAPVITRRRRPTYG